MEGLTNFYQKVFCVTVGQVQGPHCECHHYDWALKLKAHQKISGNVIYEGWKIKLEYCL